MSESTAASGTAAHGLVASHQPLQTAYDCALLDLDGVVYRGADPVEHAADAIAAARACGMSTVFVTNNAARPPEVVADQLTSLDIPTSPGEVMTSSLAAASILADELHPGDPVLAIGGPGLHKALRQVGLTVVTSAEDSPVAVVQGYGPDVGWRDLAEAVYAISAGARYVATNLDATLPTERGMAPGNGSLVAAVVNATGVRPASAGKPQPEIFRRAAAGHAKPVVIGDRLDTDLAGARAAGMAGLHVLTGVSDALAVLRAEPDQRPHFLGLDLRALAMPHPVPTRGEDGVWRCGAAAVRHEGTGLAVSRSGEWHAFVAACEVTIDEYRAACAAAWSSADDEGVELDLPSSPLTVTQPARGAEA